jgi:hypothetical protein
MDDGGDEEGTPGQHATLVLDSSSSDKEWMAEYAKMMAGLKRRRGGQMEDETEDEETEGTHNRRKKRRTEATTTMTTLEANAESLRRRRSTGTANAIAVQRNPDTIMRGVISDFNLDSNPEQLRAFRIVADRVIRGGDQLLMYLEERVKAILSRRL